MLSSYIDQPVMPRAEVTRECSAGGDRPILRQQRLRPLSVAPGSSGSEATWVTRICFDALRTSHAGEPCLVVDQREVRGPTSTTLCGNALLAAGRSPGYYALIFPAADRKALIAALPNLGRTEALASDLDAGLATGDVTLIEYLDSVSALSRHPGTPIARYAQLRLSG